MLLMLPKLPLQKLLQQKPKLPRLPPQKQPQQTPPQHRSLLQRPPPQKQLHHMKPLPLIVLPQYQIPACSGLQE